MKMEKLGGKDAFKLYDTYGFPFELTLEIAEESNLTVNKEEFKEELKVQQERSRASRGIVQMNMNGKSKT